MSKQVTQATICSSSISSVQRLHQLATNPKPLRVDFQDYLVVLKFLSEIHFADQSYSPKTPRFLMTLSTYRFTKNKSIYFDHIKGFLIYIYISCSVFIDSSMMNIMEARQLLIKMYALIMYVRFLVSVIKDSILLDALARKNCIA